MEVRHVVNRLYTNNVGNDVGKLIEFHNSIMRSYGMLANEMGKSFSYYVSPVGNCKYKIPFKVIKANIQGGYCNLNDIPKMCKKDNNNGNGYFTDEHNKLVFDGWSRVDTISNFTQTYMVLIGNDSYVTVKFDMAFVNCLRSYISSHSLSSRSTFKVCDFYTCLLNTIRKSQDKGRATNLKALASLILGSLVVERGITSDSVLRDEFRITTNTFIRHMLFVQSLLDTRFTTKYKNASNISPRALKDCIVAYKLLEG